MQRVSIILFGTAWLFATPALSADLAGTVEVSGKPAENAVVWRELAAPPAFVQSAKVLKFLDYDTAPPRARFGRRLTLGTRVRWPGPVTVQVNYLRQRGDLPYIKKHSVDFSATYSLRFDHQFTRPAGR